MTAAYYFPKSLLASSFATFLDIILFRIVVTMGNAEKTPGQMETKIYGRFTHGKDGKIQLKINRRRRTPSPRMIK